ncbi:MAG: ketopantoate reductase family protein [Candidatus Odinarchaeota archaeon]
MVKRNLKIGFIGAGSIGSLFGGFLADIKSESYSIEVIFFCTKSHAKVVNTEGLSLYKDQQMRIIKSIKAYENEKIISVKLREDPSFTFDFIFLTTKTYDSEEVIVQYNKIINASRWLVILQNGIGNEDILLPYSKKSKIMRIVTSTGAFLEKPGHVINTGEGITKIGFPFLNEINSEKQMRKEAELDINLLKDLLNLANLETIIVEDIISECWEKVIVNIGINALGALTRLPNGKLLENNGLKNIMGELIKEVLEVARLKKIQLPKKDYVGITLDVAKKTAENKNSMLQDILNKKPTEIDFMNGRIVNYAKDLGINVPYNKTLTLLIRGLENSVI